MRCRSRAPPLSTWLSIRVAPQGNVTVGSARRYCHMIAKYRTPMTLSAFQTGPARTVQQRFYSSTTGEGGTSPTNADSDSTAHAKPSGEEALTNLLEEVQALLSRPVPIGSLFRALSADSKKTLVKNKVPLEQLLLQYPQNFVLYQQGPLRNRTIFCAPPHLVPVGARRMVIETSPYAAAISPASGGALSSSAACATAASGSLNSDDINARVLQHDPISEKQRQINTVLQYIPNEWSPFTELGIPEEVRVRCMGKPILKAMQYFEKYPQYFEVRQQGRADHTFHVRRSMALQRSQSTGQPQ